MTPRQQGARPDLQQAEHLGAGNSEDISVIGEHPEDVTSAEEAILDTALRKFHPDPVWLNRLAESLNAATREGASAAEIETDLRDIIDQAFPARARQIDIAALARKLASIRLGL